MKKYVLVVHGMKCHGCEDRITKVLKMIEGVEEVDASFESEKVIVISNKDIDENIIKEKIENLDFEVESIDYE